MEDSFTHKDCAIFLTMKYGCLCGSLILLSVSLVTFFVWSSAANAPQPRCVAKASWALPPDQAPLRVNRHPVRAGLPAKQAARCMAPASPVFAGKPAPTVIAPALRSYGRQFHPQRLRNFSDYEVWVPLWQSDTAVCLVGDLLCLVFSRQCPAAPLRRQGQLGASA